MLSLFKFYIKSLILITNAIVAIVIVIIVEVDIKYNNNTDS